MSKPDPYVEPRAAFESEARGLRALIAPNIEVGPPTSLSIKDKTIALSNDYKRYVLGVLLIIMASNYIDRNALGVLLQDIKLDLHLSDTQLGLLSGIAFALFYSVMGIPIARWADRGNRVVIISVCAALWSVAVALCGVAGNFLQLMLIRVFVGVGEAGCVPPGHSLIADYFDRDERPKAAAIFKLGVPLSLIVGYMLSGWLDQRYGWRMTFMILGIPGVALAPLAWITVVEPRRLQKSAVSLDLNDEFISTRTPQPTFQEVCLTLWQNRTFRHLMFAWSIVSLFGTGIGKWQPAFFIRSFGLSTGLLGMCLALTAGGGGFLGTYLGGMLASRYASRDERLQLRSIAVLYSCFGVVYACIFISHDPYLSFALMGLAFVGGSLGTGPLFATLQTLVPDRMRAMSIAVLLLFANLVGMGLGPLVVGALSDILQPRFGQESLRYALLSLCPGYLWCGWHFWRASCSVNADLAWQ